MSKNNCAERDQQGRDAGALPRREFIRRSAAAGIALASGTPLLAREAAATKKSLVVIVTCDAVIREDNPDRADAAVVERMLARGLCELAGKSSPRAAWKTFFLPSDAVAACDAGGHLQNVPELSAAAMKGLALAGVRKMKLGSNFVAWQDRFGKERVQKWLTPLKRGLSAAGISDGIIDPRLYGLPARFAVDPFDALLVVCTLKPHYLCGVSGVVKHFATLSKKGPAVYHPNAMVTAGAALATDFKEQRKLVVVDALRFAKTGDPHRQAKDYVFQKSLLFSTDPVAADTVALNMFLRAECRPYGRIPPRAHIAAADKQYHAGASDLTRIEARQILL